MLLLAAGFVLLAVTWATVSVLTDVALQLRHVALGGLSALLLVGSGAVLLTIQSQRWHEALEHDAVMRWAAAMLKRTSR